MSKHFKTPAGYVAPLRSKAAILAFLGDCPLTDDRGGYNYNHENYLFCFNVKVHASVDLSFDTLLAKAVEMGELDKARAADSVWVKQAREAYDKYGEEELYNLAIEDCQKSVHDCDSYKMLWNGTGAIADWAFLGRSGGWLCLTEFDGIKMDGFGKEELAELDFKTLNRLYRFIVQRGHDFREEAIVNEIQFNAAFSLFANLCSDCEATEERNDRWAKENQSGEHDFAVVPAA